MTLEPPLLTEPPKDKKRMLAIWLGLVVGIAPAVIAALLNQRRVSPRSPLPATLLGVEITLWPLIALITAIVRSSRRFGLGMLIGVGLGWLVLAAICGGMFNF